LKDLASLDAPRYWPLLTFFRQALYNRQEQDGLRRRPVRGSLGDRFAAQLGMDPRVLSFAIARETRSQHTQVPAAQVDAALETLERVQTLAEAMPAQEEKPYSMGYRAAHIAVREALERQASLLLE